MAADGTDSTQGTWYIRRGPQGAAIPKRDDVVWKKLLGGHCLSRPATGTRPGDDAPSENGRKVNAKSAGRQFDADGVAGFGGGSATATGHAEGVLENKRRTRGVADELDFNQVVWTEGREMVWKGATERVTKALLLFHPRENR